MKKLTEEDLLYIADLFDNNAVVNIYIILDKTYKYNYKFIFTLVFYTKTEKYWILIRLFKMLNYGFLKKKLVISEYNIKSTAPIYYILLKIKDYVKIKKSLVDLLLEIIKEKENIKSLEDFIKVCKLIDKFNNLQNINYKV